MDTFVNLHVHSSYSDGMGTMDAIVQRAVDLGQIAIGITDHGSTGGLLEFKRTCDAKGIKPILGCELYYEMDNGKTAHITALAKNEVGFWNLIKLNNAGHSSLRKKPSVTLQDIVKHKNGLIILSGCPASPIVNADPPEINNFVRTLEAFFEDDFYIEINFTAPGIWKKQLKIAEQYDIQYVVTSDAHFVKEEHAKLHYEMSKLLRGYAFPNDRLFIASTDDIKRFAKKDGFTGNITTAITNSYQIATKIEDYKIDNPPYIPAPPDAKDEVILRLKTGQLWHGVDGIKEYTERIEYETGVIDKMGYWDYFWLVSEIVNYAKANDIRMGYGRGSAAGSLILYLLGITQVDPLKYGLIFERFLNPSRHDYPDIDLDFEHARRDEIIDYAAQRWGAVPITTTSRYSHKSLIHDLAKIFHISKTDEDNLIEDETFFETYSNNNPEFADAYSLLIGSIRHKGKHASGFVIAGERTIPVERQKGGLLATPVSTSKYGDDLTPYGIIKLDILGISSLSAVKRMEDLSR